MDGLINLYKPAGLSSAKALYRVRKLTSQRKSGHAGTLDPGAEGVLILCLGRATRLVEKLMDQPKVYRAEARLDVTSASFDADRPLEPVAASAPAADCVVDAVQRTTGRIMQTPPAISALKVGGRPAYRLVLQGQPPELPPRPVWLYWARVHRYRWPALDFEICCGRGFYVRAFIRDLGAHLGTGGCLTRLIRTQVGPFGCATAVTLEALSQGRPEDFLLPVEVARARLAGSTQPPCPPESSGPDVSW